ncbi:MAG: hypothetical protein ACREOY_15115, partial [Candidatus Dormibacteraceae bacterium]
MESQSPDSQEAAPLDEPAAAVPTHETTPVWARTVPVVPPVSDNGTQDAVATAPEADPLPALPMQKESDPDWAKTETPAESAQTDPKEAVPMQKPAPKWAQTVPAPPGEPVSETELPATTSKRTWPPAEGRKDVPLASEPGAPAVRAQGVPMDQDDAAPAQGAVPEEVDIWPPDPPTEHSMPAWPPSSTISEGMHDASEHQAEPISSWPDTFDSVPEVTKPPAMTALPPATKPPVTTKPPAASKPAAATKPAAPAVPQAAT